MIALVSSHQSIILHAVQPVYIPVSLREKIKAILLLVEIFLGGGLSHNSFTFLAKSYGRCLEYMGLGFRERSDTSSYGKRVGELFGSLYLCEDT